MHTTLILRAARGLLAGKAGAVALVGAAAMGIALMGPTALASAATAPAPRLAQQQAGSHSETLPSGRADAVLTGSPGLRRALSDSGSMGARWSINIPCGFTCGANSSGGDHFWVIASYQQIANATIVSIFGTACAAYLSGIIDPFAAAAVCGTAVAILHALAANEPRVSNHGVWIAIYFSHPWSPSYGRY